MAAVATVAYYLLLLFFFALWARFILDLVSMFSRDWRPRGLGLVLAEAVYGVTDPPIRAARKVLPPIRIGAAALDFGWSIVMLGTVILIYVAVVLKTAV